MNFELFIAKRISARKPGKKNGVRSLVNISMVAIALSITIMILSISILVGFKKEIKRKISGFSAHIQVSRLTGENSRESQMMKLDETFLKSLRSHPYVANVYPFATKPALLKSGTDLQGVVLKGVDSNFSWEFFSSYLLRGRLPDLRDSSSLDIMISTDLANLLKRDTADRLPAYFIEDPPRMRPFRISGIYSTGLAEYDRMYVYCHLQQIRIINGWETNEAGGIGIMLLDPDRVDRVAGRIRSENMFLPGNDQELAEVQTIRDLAPGFFDFLSLTDTNVWVILSLMILVAGFNMISGLLILILDRTRMIGILRSLGAQVYSLQRIFLYQSAWIIGKGLILGNILGIGLAVIQKQFKLITLDPESYFIDSVPVFLNPLHLVWLNVATLVLTLLMLIIPSRIISKLSPEKTIKFD